MVFKICAKYCSAYDDDNNNPGANDARNKLGSFTMCCCPCFFRLRKPVSSSPCEDSGELARSTPIIPVALEPHVDLNKNSPLIDDGDRYSINSSSRVSRQAFVTKSGSTPNSPESINTLPKISPGSVTRQATTQTGNSHLRYHKKHRKTPSPDSIGDGIPVDAANSGTISPALNKGDNASTGSIEHSEIQPSVEHKEQESYVNKSIKLVQDSVQRSAPSENIQDEEDVSDTEYIPDPAPQFLDLQLVEQQLIEELQKHIINPKGTAESATPSLKSISGSAKSINPEESPISAKTPRSARTKSPASVPSRTPISARTPEIVNDIERNEELDTELGGSDTKSQTSSPCSTVYSAMENGSMISVSGLSEMDSPSLADTRRTSALLRRRKQIAIPLPKSSNLFKNKVKPSYTIKAHVDNSNQPLENPKDTFTKTVKDLESPDWEKTMYGFKYLSRLLTFHNDVIEQNMHVVITLIAKHVKNLRSQVARVACQTSGELFSVPRKGLDVEMEDLAVPLLHRTADTNKFLRADSIAALDVMCDNLPTNRVIGVLTGKGASHQNAVVRCACARLLSGVIIKLGYNKVFALNKDIRDKVLITGSKFLLEGSLETRGFAKEIFKELCRHDYFNKIIMDVVPTRTYRNISKTLKCLQNNI